MPMPGERGGELLPLLLKPGTLTKMSKAERAALRQRTGLDSFADMVRIAAAAAGVPMILRHRKTRAEAVRAGQKGKRRWG